jgi:hypothetical protein
MTGVVASHGTDGNTFEERWAAWVARGAAQDKTIARRAVVGAIVLAAGLGVWLANLLMFG